MKDFDMGSNEKVLAVAQRSFIKPLVRERDIIDDSIWEMDTDLSPEATAATLRILESMVCVEIDGIDGMRVERYHVFDCDGNMKGSPVLYWSFAAIFEISRLDGAVARFAVLGEALKSKGIISYAASDETQGLSNVGFPTEWIDELTIPLNRRSADWREDVRATAVLERLQDEPRDA